MTACGFIVRAALVLQRSTSRLALLGALGWLGACAYGDVESEPAVDPAPSEPAAESDAASPVVEDAAAPAVDAGSREPLELHLVYVHGVGDSNSYARSDGALADLDAAVLTLIDERRPEFELASGRKLAVTSHRFNLYTDASGQLASPGTDEGSREEVAEKWRSRLAAKLAEAFPNGEKNILLVGHSTGARAAVEVSADVGGSDNALGAGKWGFGDRIAGVVSVHGMLDALGRYEALTGLVPFELGCKVVKPSGWCGYAAKVSALPAADWVSTHRHSLVLTSVVRDGRCGQTLWNEPADQTLPVRAQGNPAAYGLGLAVDGDGVYRPAHGVEYGEFCHSDITDPGKARHADAVAAASTRIAAWLFDSAPRVVNASAESQSYATPVLQGLTSATPFVFSFSCPVGSAAIVPIDVVGNCHHPGYFDGDDHAMSAPQIVSTADNVCGGSVSWKNIHDHPHSGTLWFKSYATGTGGVLATLL